MPSVSVLLPVLIEQTWQRHMSTACIRIMRDTTEVPFELIVVETESVQLRNAIPAGELAAPWNEELVDLPLYRYINHPDRTTLVKDLNAGIDAASGEFVVMTANDIYMKPGWLEALLDCFARYEDCGIASLRCAEVGMPFNPQPWHGNGDGPPIMEGWYGPLIMWKRGWRFDEAYESMACDNDLIMRMYHAGKRAYYNRKVVPIHLNNQTWQGRQGEEIKRAHATFMQKWGSSPYWAASMILRGGVAFGREWER